MILGQDCTQLTEPPIAIKMPDNSMEPRIPKGTRMIVLPHQKCAPGNTVLAVLPKLGMMVIRKFDIERGPEGPRKVLRPTNPDETNRERELREDAGDWCWPVAHAIVDL